MAAPKPSDKEEKEARAIRESRASENRRSKRPKKLAAKDILNAASETNFTNLTEAQEFESRYKEKIGKRPGNQILHVMAKKSGWSGDMRWSDENIKGFLDWTLERYHSLLEVKNDDLYTPLHLALMDHNTAFVDAVLQHSKLINLGTVLPETCQYGNSLHVAIKYRLHSINLMVDKCAQFNQMFTKGHPENGNTPLHACMSMDMNDDGEESDMEAESDGDGDQSRSYQNQEEREVRAGDEEEHRHDAKNSDWIQVENGLGERKSTRFDSKSPITAHRRGSHAFPPQRAQSFPAPAMPEPASLSVLGIVELLVQKHDSVLSHHNTAKRTPYQERIHQLRTSPIIEKELEKIGKRGLDEDMSAAREMQRIIAKDPIALYIRSYCVRNFLRDRIVACLYQPGQERHIEFDLGGLPHPTISEGYLDRLSKHLQFESILKYVALPKLTMESPTAVRKRRGGEQALHRRGLSDLVAVFDWLRRNHVEKIVKVMVIDDGDPSHADASIEEALRDFNVEIWDWKRLDLSTEVIWKSTNVVKEISLYSTGNNAVLMGWASPQGLPNKKNFPMLKKVNLYIREGQEDHERLNEYIKTFKDTITRETNDRIKVHHILDNKDVSYASEFKSSEGYMQPENSWIECAVNFAKLLRTAPCARSVPVKIAIIDDGVDASLISLDGKIAIGKSFCPYPNSTDLMSPYYVPSGNHGTCMATLICRICPEVSLYVARLDERQPVGSSQRQITAKSAADAIRWATDCGVDIISMSWTIETPVTGNDDMESLKAAAREAAGKEILMFCSTSDQGSSTRDQCYPGDFEGCIKIGGATDTGEALAWVNAEKVHFLLPGKNVPFTDNEGKIISYESGSSVATAAASGLAGLLMFCSRLIKEDDRYLEDQKNMRDAFKALASGDKFPRVQEFFDQRFKQHLARLENPDSSQKPKNTPPAYNILTLDWNDKCSAALEYVMGLIKAAAYI